MGTSTKATNRPKKRVLVRWDENLNELLLLTVQSVCNANMIRIPWVEVAGTMGHNVTEGAIVQHLSKLRNRRVAANKAVPPPLRRGGAGTSSKTVEVPSANTRPAVKRKLRNVHDSESEGNIGRHSHRSGTASDEEYIQGRSKARMRSTKTKKSRVQPTENMESESECDTDQAGIDSIPEDFVEELLVPGASFLEYPNDKAPPRAPSLFSPKPKESKIIVLKYRRSENPQRGLGLPQCFADTASDAVNQYDRAYQNTYCQFPDQDLPEIHNNNFMDIATALDITANYIPAVNSTMDMSSIGSGERVSNLALFAPLQRLPIISYTDYYTNNQEESVVFSPEATGHPNVLLNDDYQYLHSEYVQLDENISPFGALQDMKESH